MFACLFLLVVYLSCGVSVCVWFFVCAIVRMVGRLLACLFVCLFACLLVAHLVS